jgi:hypothetical protein
MHVYALIHQAAIDLVLPRGIAQALETISCGQMAAVVEPGLALEPLQADDTKLLEAVLAHDRVIRELFLQTTVLPLRFTAFPERESLLADLQTNQQTYLETLARLRGRAEYAVKFEALPTAIEPVDPNLTGKAYFLAKKQHYQGQQRQQELQDTELNALIATISQHYPVATQPSLQQIYILAEQNNPAKLEAQLAQLSLQASHWRLTWGEPLPPFHFV